MSTTDLQGAMVHGDCDPRFATVQARRDNWMIRPRAVAPAEVIG